MSGKNGEFLGTHLLIDLWDCDPEIITNKILVQEVLESALEKSKLTMLKSVFHKFEPIGVSGFILLAESHASIHTWPEHGIVSIDFYTCGVKTIKATLDTLKAGFKSGRSEIKEMDRARLGPKVSS